MEAMFYHNGMSRLTAFTDTLVTTWCAERADSEQVAGRTSELYGYVLHLEGSGTPSQFVLYGTFLTKLDTYCAISIR